MPYLHRSIHPDGATIDPAIVLLHSPGLYLWASIPADCQKCHQPICALFNRNDDSIYALACPNCSGETL